MTLLISSARASANAIYYYQGAPFDFFTNSTPPAGSYSSGNRVSIVIEFPEPLAPNLANDVTSSVLSLSITDGRKAFNYIPRGIAIYTDASGGIVGWSIDFTTEAFQHFGAVGDQATYIYSHRIPGTTAVDDAKLLECTFSSSGSCLQALYDQGQVLRPGVWTLIPEPS